MHTKTFEKLSSKPPEVKEKIVTTKPVKGKFKSYLHEKKECSDDSNKEKAPSPMQLMSSQINISHSAQGASVDKIGSLPPLEQLFNELVGGIQMLIQTGDTETTFYLTGSNTQFSGLEISIKEYSSAPKAFNIELKGTPEMVTLLNNHLVELAALFHSTPMTFTVNRLEANLSQRERISVKKQEKDANRDSPQPVNSTLYNF